MPGASNGSIYHSSLPRIYPLPERRALFRLRRENGAHLGHRPYHHAVSLRSRERLIALNGAVIR